VLKEVTEEGSIAELGEEKVESVTLEVANVTCKEEEQKETESLKNQFKESLKNTMSKNNSIISRGSAKEKRVSS